jgi:hypothetical protein
MSEMSAFQRKFLNRAEAVDLFTQAEFDTALAEAQQEILQMAIRATKEAILVEREKCAKVADELNPEIGAAIRARKDKPDAEH